jgi:hypothetical protein
VSLLPINNVYVGTHENNQLQDNAVRLGYAVALRHVENLEYSHQVKTIAKEFTAICGCDVSALFDSIMELVHYGR